MGAKRLGYGGAKRLGLKIEAKRLGGKRLGGKRLGGETSCYRSTHALMNHFLITQRILHIDSKCSPEHARNNTN